MMRLLVVLVALAMLLSSTALAQRPGTIAVFSDAGGTDCNFVDDGGLLQVHMFHIFHDDVLASRFMLDVSLTDWFFLGDFMVFEIVVDGSTTGVGVYYGTCQTGPTYLGYAQFFGSTAPACTPIGIVAHPNSYTGEVDVADCYGTYHPATGREGVVNPDQSCMCSPPVPVEQTTWGQIKAQY